MSQIEEARVSALELQAQGRPLAAAEVLLRAGGEAEALALANAHRDDPRDGYALLMLLGRHLAGAGRVAEAAEVLRAACVRSPASGEAHCELGLALAALGEIDAALQQLGESLQLDPSRVASYEALVQLLWELGKPKAALQFLRRAVCDLPIPELHFLLARAAALARDLPVARAAMSWLRDHTPESAQRCLDLGSLELALGQLEDAAREYRRAAELDPFSPEAQHALATLHLEQDQPAEAEAAFRRALELDLGYWPSNNDLGLLLLSSGRADEAVTLLRRAVSLQAQEPVSQLNLALALLAAGSRTAALRHARAAASLARDDEVLAQASDLVRQLG